MYNCYIVTFKWQIKFHENKDSTDFSHCCSPSTDSP